MRPIAPRFGDAEELMIAEEQPEYLTLPAAVVHWEGEISILTRWQPTAEERRAIAAGQDVYVLILTRGHPLQPLAVTAGPPSL